MPLQKNLNVKPYYADYTPLSDYYQVLFKAGYPVQARELTNSQSILQNQIETFMSRFLKEGDNVVPGEFGFSLSSYVRISSVTQGATAEDFVGYTLTGAVSGVKAFVNYATPETTDDDLTFFVNYENSGTTGEYETFIEGEILESDHPNKYTASVGVTGVSKPLEITELGVTIASPAMGKGSIFTIEEGSYFIDGVAVRNSKQTIALDKYSTKPTYSVGFVVSETFVTSAEDPLLLDNSQGSSNFAAPGADRLKITLTLQKRSLDSANVNFIKLGEIVQGNFIAKPDQTVKWDWLFDILAKRTFDESGDYIVTEFPIEALEYWNNDTVNGLFDIDAATQTYPPIPGSGSTDRLTQAQADDKYVVKVSPGEAYVQGYEVGFKRPIYLFGDKARTQSFRENTITQITDGFHCAITNLNTIPDFLNINSTVDTQAFDSITLYRNFIDGYVGEGTQTDAISGAIQPFNIGNAPQTTYHCIMNQAFTGQVSGAGISVVYQGYNSCVVTSSATEIVRGTTLGGAVVMAVTKITPAPAGVLNPRYLLPNAVVDLANGTEGYNSTYDMGILTSSYFTQLAMVNDENSSNFTDAWIVGDLVYGEKSLAQGVVEAGSTAELLIVSDTLGEFIPGEDVTQGDKVSRIAAQGEAYGLKFIDSGTNNSTTSLSAETSVTVTAIGATTTLQKATDYNYDSIKNELVLLPPGRNKLRNFPYPEGSVLNTRINYALESTPSGIKGYVTQLAGKIENTLSKTHSFFSDLSDTNNFSADISIDNNTDAEILNVADGSLFSARQGSNVLTCDNFSGDPADQLQFGDLVTFVDDTGASESKLVYFVTKPVGYGSERSKSLIYLTTTVDQNVTGKGVQRIRIKAKGEPEQNLIFQLPQEVVGSLQNDPLTTRINYSVLQEFVIQVDGGQSEVVLNTNRVNEAFIANLNQTIVSVANTPNDPSNTNNYLGRQLAISSVDTSEAGGSKVTYTLAAPLPTTCDLKIIAPVFVSNAQAKQKKLIRDAVVTTTIAEAGKELISLQKADVFTLTSVTMGDTKIDVGENYIFDNGQRDNVYGIATLRLKPGSPAATDYLTITYDYFEHSGDSDFFSVDSYTSEDGVGYRAVPLYNSISAIPRNSKGSAAIVLPLRDCVDFRPVVNTGGANPSIIAPITSSRDQTGSVNFIDAGTDPLANASVPRIPISGSNFQCDMSYYLPKIDTLFIEKTGALQLVSGTPAVNPIAAPDLSTGIRLYDIFVPPYTFETQSLGIQKYNYKRYRMKDISTLERRINRLEDLVTLSILEQAALNMQVRDAVTGLDRFKNGIVVDTFRDHSQGAVGTSQYRNSIDPRNTHLRAPHFTDQVELNEASQTPEQRTGNGYRKTGPHLTVNYTSQRFIQNPNATRTINLQPYSVFTYDGSMVLTPSVDTFEDITKLPDLIIRDTTVFDAMQNLTTEMANSGIGTVWGSWETTGQSRTSVSNERQINGSRREIRQARNALEAQGVNIGVTQWAGDVLAGGGTPPLVVRDVSTSVESSRQQTKTTINVATGAVKDTSYGERVVDVQLAKTCRSIPIQVQAGRLKPNTRYYVFFDDIDCTSWFAVDNLSTDFPDGKARYTGTPGLNSKGFGYNIMSDDVGNVAGVFLIPNGRPPVANQPWTGLLENVTYQTSGPTRSFNTGQRKVRLTTSPTDSKDTQNLDAFAEADFVSSGVLLDKQETIVSTTIPSFSSSTQVIATENRWDVTNTSTEANYYDPVAQTFLIDANNPEGVMVTELDVFFETKDATQSVEAYLATTDGQVPSEQILPFSKVVKPSDSTMRVKAVLEANYTTVTIEAGSVVTGSNSGSTGIVKSVVKFEAASINATTNVSNHVYNVLLSNYSGEFIAGEPVTFGPPPGTTEAQVLKATYQIVPNEYDVADVEITQLGTGYHNPVVTFSAPQLPGGVTATATARVGRGSTTSTGDIIYEINVTNRGSGYTSIPSVSISDSLTTAQTEAGFTEGSGAAGAVRVQDGIKGVEMGVATSDDATAATTFRFEAPVYLLGETNYAFVVKCPTSLNYRMYTAKLGENILGTESRVTQQASLGSLFKSQNGGLWTEDQTQDVKFVLRRAEFETAAAGVINLENAPLTKRSLGRDPIETNVDGINTVSPLFGDNPQVIRVFAKFHGLEPDDLVALEGLTTVGGIPATDLNTVHTVLDAGLEYFTVMVRSAATSAARGGGNVGLTSINRPYEVLNVYTGLMLFGTSQLNVTNAATQAAALNGFNILNRYKQDPPNVIKLADSYYYNGPKQVANEMNEAKYRGSLYLRGEKSMRCRIEMRTLSSKVSPVINLQRTNATVVRSLIDNPKPNDDIQGVRTGTLTMAASTASLTSVVPNYTLAFTNSAGTARTVQVVEHNMNTRKIKVRGQHVEELLSSPTYTDATINSIGTSNVTTTDGMTYLPETNPNGSVYAKWLSRLFIFENACDGIQLKLAACYYSKDSVKCYYRPRNVGFDGDITQLNWTPFNGTGLADNIEKVEVRDTDNVDPRVIQQDGWRNLTFSAQDIPPFDAVEVKVVMTQDNPALAPLIDDMQLVVTE